MQPFYQAGWVGSVEKVRVISVEKVRVITEKVIRGKEVMLPTMTLSKLLDANGVKSIDFMSMDIEGSEENALAGFDISRFKPSLVCIERTDENEHAIDHYFAANDYQLINEYVEVDGWNSYFKPK